MSETRQLALSLLHM